MSYSFLLASWGSSGNLNPLLTAARQLRRNGHRVRVIADPAMRGEVEAAGVEFITWRRAPIGTDADPADFSDMEDWARRAIFNPAIAYASDIRDEVRRVPTDAVLTLDILFGVVLGAEAAGVPVAMLSPHVSIRPLPGIPPATTGMARPKTREERAEVAAANENFANFMNGFLPFLNNACAELGVSPFSHVLDVFDRSDRLLLAISRAFDFQPDFVPWNLCYVGPLLDQPSWTKPWQASWPAEPDRPRVLVACSTGAQGQQDLVQRILNAMGSVDADAVATAGPNLNIAGLRAPENVCLLHSVPHDEVMAEVSLVVTQGGHGTVNRALINGLPLLVLPLARDQAANAARVEDKGAGLRLDSNAPEEAIAAAVKRLLTEPHFRAAARRLGDAIQADIERSALVGELETMVAARRGAGMAASRASSQKDSSTRAAQLIS
jgi:MGT family glycosyltransferase